ncbi:thioredoxin-like protein, partial [Tilletiaria anomala UBC 951]
CQYSKRAKELLNSIKATFKIVEVDTRDDHDELQKALAAISGHNTFPTIFVQDKLLGGWDELEKMHKTGLLTQILKEVQAI